MRMKNWLVYYIHDRKLKEFAGKYVKGRLINIGCGRKPYRDLLQPHVAEHIGLDRHMRRFTPETTSTFLGPPTTFPPGRRPLILR